MDRDDEMEKPEVAVLVDSLLELESFGRDKNKALAHVVNGTYNHNAVSKKIIATDGSPSILRI